MPTTFAQFLLKNELASSAELEDASQATVLYGGRLGTALIELGIFTPEQLDAALARHHHLPEIPREWFSRPDAGARAALHLDLIKRNRAFPLFFEKRSLHVGLVDPHDAAVLDNLAFASGCLIVPYALAEYRFVELMRRIYNISPSARFRMLLDEGHRARAQRERQEQRAREAAAAESEESTDELLEIGPVAADLDSQADAFFVSANAGTSPLAAPPPARAPSAVAPAQALASPAPLVAAAAPEALADDEEPELEIDPAPIVLDRRAPQQSLEALERTLAESGERAPVIEAALALASRFAETAALFVIRDGAAAGLAAQRAGYALDVDAAVLPLSSDGALARCFETRLAQRTLPQSPLDQRLSKVLHGAEGAELAIYPVAIGERVVNLLVVQAAEGRLALTADAALSALAPQLGAAYQRLIRAQKQKARTPEAELRARAKAPIGALALQKRVVRVPAGS